jgi:serine protease Do
LDLIDAVGDTTPGKETSAKILRNSKSLDLKVVVAERPSDAKLAKAEKASVSAKGEDAPYKIGMKLGDMSAELRANWDLPDEIVKPVVLEVRHGSIASRIGVKPGDIVLSVNKTDVETAKDAVGAFKKGQNEIRLARESRIIIITFEAD